MWWGLLVPSLVTNVSAPWFLKLPGGKICDNRAPFGGSVLRQIGRVQREPPLVFTISRGLTAEDNGYIQVAYMMLAYSVTLHKGQLRQRVKRKGL